MSKIFDSGDWTGGKRERDKRTICWCGDPNCNAGGTAPPFFGAAEVIPSNGATNMSESDRMRAAYERVFDEAMRRGINPNQYINREPFANMRLEGPAEPAALTEARSRIKKYLLDETHTVAWDDVIGNTVAKAALIEAIEAPTQEKDLYDFYGMRPPKGVLLFGPPGCGKTMFAKASAAAMTRLHGKKVEIIAISGPELQSPYIGVTERTIQEIFTYAREYRKHHGHPLVLFIDECETLLPDRTGRTRRVAPWEESQVAQFLSELDGMETLGAFVILATNRPEAIDEALLRDGRCDRKIKVERPNRDAVAHILRNTLRGIPSEEPIDNLVFAGVESFFNAAFVIHEGHIIIERIEMKAEPQVERMRDIATNFCLEHIVSGAMVAGIGPRVKSRAFTRDRLAGTRSGIRTQDIIDAVKEVYEENKGLEHAFALQEWQEGLNMQALLDKEINKGKLQ